MEEEEEEEEDVYDDAGAKLRGVWWGLRPYKTFAKIPLSIGLF